MKILTIIGARPQFIKSVIVSRELSKYAQVKEIILHTGQHYDRNMWQVFFKELNLPRPNYFLGINGLNHGTMTGRMMEQIEKIIIKESPDVVLLYGDTNSTLAGALSGSKLHICLAHIEAGLRSFNMQMPEEINRVLIDRVSGILFCPTNKAVENLREEGFFKIKNNRMIQNKGFGKVVKTGDVMYDMALYCRKYARPPKNVNDDHLKFILCTLHREENITNFEKLKNILEAIVEISKDIHTILPVHPRTKENIKLLSLSLNNINIIEPVSYFEMLWLINNCKLVITDSGGLQKEAFFFERPCLTLREETEWTELIEIGANILVGTDKNKIVEVVKNMDKYFNKFYSPLSRGIFDKLYGDGKASANIVKELLNL